MIQGKYTKIYQHLPRLPALLTRSFARNRFGVKATVAQCKTRNRTRKHGGGSQEEGRMLIFQAAPIEAPKRGHRVSLASSHGRKLWNTHSRARKQPVIILSRRGCSICRRTSASPASSLTTFCLYLFDNFDATFLFAFTTPLQLLSQLRSHASRRTRFPQDRHDLRDRWIFMRS